MMVGCANKETTTDTNKGTKEKPIVNVLMPIILKELLKNIFQIK
ncbi:hypothetical protein [Anaerosalibacter sp. Marseille-P3206]|nr:hypothetical protein [Anaerosalibacter sp. Marseille-P3206]